MKDYYFLLLAVALSIFAAIRQNKKKSENTDPVLGKPERPGNHFLDQLMGEGFWDESTGYVSPPQRVNPPPRPPASGTGKDSKPGELYHPGFKRTLPNLQQRTVALTVRKPAVNTHEAASETDETPGYLEDFSLRKAFVYSEIMTRKYESVI